MAPVLHSPEPPWELSAVDRYMRISSKQLNTLSMFAYCRDHADSRAIVRTCHPG